MKKIKVILAHDHGKTTVTNGALGGVVLSYRDKVKEDLVISREKFANLKKYCGKWKFYRDHIEYLEAELSKAW